ncbi:hypothetical protein MKEN_00664400 [Mycena kentingensis (nom. inval.)]|nr:hypothetical protein MKEN_00664400 [Mycena kentingensis (nom. inval.)]
MSFLLTNVYQALDSDIPEHATHPFSPQAEEACTKLSALVQSTAQLSTSLDSFAIMSWSKPKLVSLLRQQTITAETFHGTTQTIKHIANTLRSRSGTNSEYGEDIPLEPQAIAEWCIGRLQFWATSVGLEAYREDGAKAGLLLAGLVFAMDVEFSVDTLDSAHPKINVATVKTAYSGSSDTSPALDTFMARTIQSFCDELNKTPDVRDSKRVARLGSRVIEQLRYLRMLDPLAKAESPPEQVDGENTGVRWFTDMDKLYPVLEEFSRAEAAVVASSLSALHAPLDIYLPRCHALPLPYLVSPSITFLVYLSPQAYLSLKKSVPSPSSDSKFDIPLDLLRSHLCVPRKGATIRHSPALLAFWKATVPTFAFHARASRAPNTPEAPVPGPATEKEHIWILDFTHGGERPGVIMSQSRMREIELILHPLGGMDAPLTLPMNMMSFGTGLNPANPVSSERYTALYRSPSNLHPPLQLRLTLPEEPGFLLGKVPVHSMKELWAILEVVREQCWLNEILLGCHWSTEGIAKDAEDVPADDTEATEEQLAAILNGTTVPRKIPVNVSLPQRSESLFDTSLDPMNMPSGDRRTRILMTCPERPPASGVVEITVAYDETRSRGVAVEVTGALGSEVKTETMEEIVRRGGALGLAGRLWTQASS